VGVGRIAPATCHPPARLHRRHAFSLSGGQERKGGREGEGKGKAGRKGEGWKDGGKVRDGRMEGGEARRGEGSEGGRGKVLARCAPSPIPSLAVAPAYHLTLPASPPARSRNSESPGSLPRAAAAPPRTIDPPRAGVARNGPHARRTRPGRRAPRVPRAQWPGLVRRAPRAGPRPCHCRTKGVPPFAGLRPRPRGGLEAGGPPWLTDQ
jgi:hypothetical protein